MLDVLRGWLRVAENAGFAGEVGVDQGSRIHAAVGRMVGRGDWEGVGAEKSVRDWR